MASIKMRFNTKYMEGDQSLMWRILVDETEYLAQTIRVNVPCFTSEDIIETGETKWHITCEEQVTWQSQTELVIGI